MRARTCLRLTLLLLVASCKSRESREAERLETNLSWIATAGSVTRGWADNRLPVRYVEHVLIEAHAALVKNEDSTSAGIVASLAEAVARRDRGGTGSPMAALVAQWSALQAQSEKYRAGGQ